MIEFEVNRREVIKGSAAASLTMMAPTAGPTKADAAKQDRSIIKNENAKTGTRDWQLTRVRINKGKFRTSLIEGYCSHQSISAGQTLQIFVSAEPARKFTLDIYRMGYYSGTGARLMTTLGPLPGKTQPVPPIGKEPGRLRECKWEPSTEIPIPQDWPSGVYLGKLTTISEAKSEPYWQSYIIFIVTDKRPADILFQCSDNTWQAYNRWPENESLYTHPNGGHAPGVAVSFDRPYGMYTQIFKPTLSIGSGEFLLWEFPLCYWLEKHGYDVTYGTNCDTMDANFIQRCRTFLSVGHDEYWDILQYKAAEASIEAGVNYLWLCGNSVFIESPFSPNSGGALNRAITRRGCYGPLRKDEVETYGRLFADLKDTGPDERKIIGASSVVPFNGGGDWTCTKPDHWIFN